MTRRKRSTLDPRIVVCAGDLIRQRRLTWRKFARAVGVPTSTAHDMWKRLQAAGEVPTAEDWDRFYRVVGDLSQQQQERQETDRFRWEATGDTATLEAPTGRVRTLEELLALAKVDRDEWKVDRYVVNSWEQSAMTPAGPVVTPLFQVKAWLSRRKPPVDFPAPVVLRIVRPKTPKSRGRAGRSFVAVHYSDIHFPHHDPRALSILYQVLDITNPDLVVDHGDTADCQEISRYEKDPFARVSLADELRMVAEHHARVHAITPRARHVWLLGNHEDRIRRQIWAIAQDRVAGELVTLPGVRQALDLARLTGVDQLGWEVVDYPRHVVLFDRLIVTHGEAVRKGSAASARAEYERYGMSGMSGHTHRRGVYEHRDYSGVHAWWELGCMCRIRDDYVSFPDWQQGMAVVTWSHDRTHFAVEEIRIHEGRAFFRGQLLVGKEGDL